MSEYRTFVDCPCCRSRAVEMMWFTYPFDGYWCCDRCYRRNCKGHNSYDIPSTTYAFRAPARAEVFHSYDPSFHTWVRDD